MRLEIELSILGMVFLFFVLCSVPGLERRRDVNARLKLSGGDSYRCIAANTAKGSLD